MISNTDCVEVDALCIMSYNCRGFNSSKLPFIRDLLSTHDVSVLLLQEHWLSDDQIDLLRDIDQKYLYMGISGFKRDEILTGRPYGGCAILWKTELSTVTFIPTSSSRICGLHIVSNQLKLLVINVYMPCESDASSSDDFQSQLSVIENLINEYNDCHVTVAGDFNVDFSRARSLHTTLLNHFCTHVGLVPIANHSVNSVDFSYHFNHERFSYIDHFLLSPILFDTAVLDSRAIHSVDNTSDHEPLILQLNFKTDILQVNDKTHVARPSWVRAKARDIENYRTLLSDQLRSVYLPVEALACSNLQCSNEAHLRDIDLYSLSLNKACVTAAENAIPFSSPPALGGRIPGWNERAKPLREKSILWHNIWIECGRPRNGEVANVMRRTRAAYHNEIRKIRKDKENIVKQRVADSMLSESGRDFWGEIKKIRKKGGGYCGAIDGCTDTAAIAELFADNYRDLYTTVPYDRDDMMRITREVNSLLSALDALPADCTFLVDEVKQAVTQMKRGKSDGCSSLTSDHIINAGDDLLHHLSGLFSAFCIHGTVSDDFYSSVIIPIPKNRNVSAASSSNYRGIALSSLFGKILDYIVLHRYIPLLISSEYQFGFKRKCSTNLCSMILKESINYYLNSDSTVFVSFLDASKAFDRINYCKLFRLLFKRNLPAPILRLLINVYVNNNVCVSWAGMKSTPFIALNGVKQGAILSPILFCIYIDDLLLLLSKCGMGCYIGYHFVGVLAYADDIVLVAPTATAMRKLLAICDEYASQFDILFNSSKSKWMAFLPNRCRSLSSQIDNCGFALGGAKMERVHNYSHLGHVIASSNKDDEDINRARFNFIGQSNNTSCYFSKLNVFTRFKLFQSYCTSFYGSELWDLYNDKVATLCTDWRKAMRVIWRLPRQTHSYLLHLISGCLPIYDELCRRFINFARICVNHSSSLVRFVSSYCLFHGNFSSFLKRNLNLCCHRYQCSAHVLLHGFLRPLFFTHAHFSSVNEHQRHTASFALELILLINETLSNGLLRTEIYDILTSICCD